MTKRRHQPPVVSAPQSLPGRRAQPSGYDWSRFGRHRLRAPASVVIDLPIASDAASAVWVATVWPDPRAPGGWERIPWGVDQHAGRGWVLPQQLAAGDVLEFGADTPTTPVRWYGVLDSYEFDRWLTVQGPYPHLTAAYDDAQRLLALERYLPALEPDSHLRVRVPCARGRRPRRRSG
jgi:hypothetical protein